MLRIGDECKPKEILPLVSALRALFITSVWLVPLHSTRGDKSRPYLLYDEDCFNAN